MGTSVTNVGALGIEEGVYPLSGANQLFFALTSGIPLFSVNGGAYAPIVGTSSSALTTVPTLGAGVDMAPAINTALGLNAAGIQLNVGIYELWTKVSFTSNGQRIRGSGAGKMTEVKPKAGVGVSAYIETVNLYSNTVENFTMTALTAHTSADGPFVRLNGASNAVTINTQVPTRLSNHVVRDMDMVGCFTGVKIDDSAFGAFNSRVYNMNIVPCNQGYGVWIHSPLGGQFLLASLTIFTLVPQATTPAKAAIRVTAAGDVTMDYINNYQCNYGLLFDATANINSLTVSNSWFDTNDENNLNATPAGGAVSRVRVTNTWFAGADVQGAGVTANKGHGVYMDTNCIDWTFTNCHGLDALSGVGACFLANGAATQIRFKSCTAGGGHIGFGIGGTASHCSILDCDVNNGSLGTITDIGMFINGGTSDSAWGQSTVHATTANVGTPTTAWTALKSY
jgi:hypothetical protein